MRTNDKNDDENQPFYLLFIGKRVVGKRGASRDDDHISILIFKDEAERKCSNLRLESLHRHNDHEVVIIIVIMFF